MQNHMKSAEKMKILWNYWHTLHLSLRDTPQNTALHWGNATTEPSQEIHILKGLHSHPKILRFGLIPKWSWCTWAGYLSGEVKPDVQQLPVDAEFTESDSHTISLRKQDGYWVPCTHCFAFQIHLKWAALLPNIYMGRQGSPRGK